MFWKGNIVISLKFTTNLEPGNHLYGATYVCDTDCFEVVDFLYALKRFASSEPDATFEFVFEENLLFSAHFLPKYSTSCHKLVILKYLYKLHQIVGYWSTVRTKSHQLTNILQVATFFFK